MPKKAKCNRCGKSFVKNARMLHDLKGQWVHFDCGQPKMTVHMDEDRLALAENERDAIHG